MNDETGWVIERKGMGLCLGVCGSRWKWTVFTDPDAMRFARKKDAEAMMRTLPMCDDMVFASEHMWVDARAVAP